MCYSSLKVLAICKETDAMSALCILAQIQYAYPPPINAERPGRDPDNMYQHCFDGLGDAFP